ncbi:hypothetical protein V496_10493 [Pseudogymnoascus sp. VKM F-4515 (FW-2607)]|nr:hypothetical protein V496_10493 [Pseudogymnoascus sp. VKM F-4515 (FW-2607)]
MASPYGMAGLVWETFKVPEAVLDTLQVASLGASFVQLPNEILFAIIEEADAIDQLALAVSCKRLLDASTGVALKSNAWAGRSMQPQYRQVLLAQLSSSSPNGWKLCIPCRLYRPTSEEYWTPKIDLDKCILYGTEQVWAIKKWTENPLCNYCPECVLYHSKHMSEADTCWNLSDARSLAPTWPAQQSSVIGRAKSLLLALYHAHALGMFEDCSSCPSDPDADAGVCWKEIAVQDFLYSTACTVYLLHARKDEDITVTITIMDPKPEDPQSRVTPG